jgi:glycosyltransferase involved in cell wall biosynthesis
MNIAFFSAGFLPAESQGGVPFSAYNLASSLRDEGHSVSIISTDRNGENRLNVPINIWTEYDELKVLYCKTFNGPYVFLNCKLNQIKNLIQSTDLVISSSTLWCNMGIVVAYYAWKYKKKHLVYTRGLLDPWALQSKPVRKFIFRITQGKIIAKLSSAFIALNESERHSIFKVYPKSNIFVIPNGCENNSKFIERDGSYEMGRSLEKNYLLFLGRVSEKKGLEQTLQSFEIAKTKSKKLLIIAGPIDKDYKEKFIELLKKYSRNIIVEPAVYGVKKKELFLNSRAFILTSKSEGMPMAALEAMSYGKPVILTKECNISEVEKYNAGWLVDYGDFIATTKAIECCLDNDKDYQVKSENALKISDEIFSWSNIAKKTIHIANQIGV